MALHALNGTGQIEHKFKSKKKFNQKGCSLGHSQCRIPVSHYQIEPVARWQSCASTIYV